MKSSLLELTMSFVTRTGYSGYSKGWAHKSVWTWDVSVELARLDIKHVIGNDAPRGGANGEYVKLVDKVLMKQIKIACQLREEERIKYEERIRKEKEAAYQEAIQEILLLPVNMQFEIKWNSLKLKEASQLSWSMYRDKLKKDCPEEWEVLKKKFRAKQDILV